MIRRPPRSTRTDTLFPYTTLFRSLEVFGDIAAQEDAPQQARDDFAALLDWMGVESADEIGTAQHEQFARGFEQYLGEGRAPSPELRHVFAQFKAWILSVYQALRHLNVTLTRSAERRVGNESVRTCRSRGSP